MHRTIWPLTVALLLQLLTTASLAWNAPNQVVGIESPTVHCHGSATHDETVSQTNLQLVGHHCCAVGLGVGQQVVLPQMPQEHPISALVHWRSWRTRPDLPPPI